MLQRVFQVLLWQLLFTKFNLTRMPLFDFRLLAHLRFFCTGFLLCKIFSFLLMPPHSWIYDFHGDSASGKLCKEDSVSGSFPRGSVLNAYQKAAIAGIAMLPSIVWTIPTPSIPRNTRNRMFNPLLDLEFVFRFAIFR